MIRDKCDELANKLLPILSAKASALSALTTDPASTKESGGPSESSQQSLGAPMQNVPPPMNRDKPITSVPPVPRGVPTIKDQRNEPPKRPI